MEILAQMGLLLTFLSTVAHSESIYLSQDKLRDPERASHPNGPYPQRSHQYPLLSPHPQSRKAKAYLRPDAYAPEYIVHTQQRQSLKPSAYGAPEAQLKADPDDYYQSLPYEHDSPEYHHAKDSHYEEPVLVKEPKSAAYQRAAEFQQHEEKPQYSRPEERRSHQIALRPIEKKPLGIDKPHNSVGGNLNHPKYPEAPPTFRSNAPPYSSQQSASYSPKPVTGDPKLPQYFTMYEKRVIADPTDRYGKGPWRYLTYGHGITYGSKEPGKVFEKGYGYIRALGRDHCQLPEHLCPPKDDKPFEYEGRKEPYFGYRPH